LRNNIRSVYPRTVVSQKRRHRLVSPFVFRNEERYSALTIVTLVRSLILPAAALLIAALLATTLTRLISLLASLTATLCRATLATTVFIAGTAGRVLALRASALIARTLISLAAVLIDFIAFEVGLTGATAT
jgi:Na+-transporting methylmalonyl-CoA/oxaloacetate decarboxylase beta subunit